MINTYYLSKKSVDVPVLVWFSEQNFRFIKMAIYLRKYDIRMIFKILERMILDAYKLILLQLSKS